jgi:hypothetical protein
LTVPIGIGMFPFTKTKKVLRQSAEGAVKRVMERSGSGTGPQTIPSQATLAPSR